MLALNSIFPEYDEILVPANAYGLIAFVDSIIDASSILLTHPLNAYWPMLAFCSRFKFDNNLQLVNAESPIEVNDYECTSVNL